MGTEDGLAETCTRRRLPLTAGHPVTPRTYSGTSTRTTRRAVPGTSPSPCQRGDISGARASLTPRPTPHVSSRIPADSAGPEHHPAARSRGATRATGSGSPCRCHGRAGNGRATISGAQAQLYTRPAADAWWCRVAPSRGGSRTVVGEPDRRQQRLAQEAPRWCPRTARARITATSDDGRLTRCGSCLALQARPPVGAPRGGPLSKPTNRRVQADHRRDPPASTETAGRKS